VALLIDMDLLIDSERGVGKAALGDEERTISVIMVGELLQGAPFP
jgi:hypothetical protein